jgi:hypothetical protein
LPWGNSFLIWNFPPALAPLLFLHSFVEGHKEPCHPHLKRVPTSGLEMRELRGGMGTWRGQAGFLKGEASELGAYMSGCLYAQLLEQGLLLWRGSVNRWV